jgi:hypothetical protein
MSRKGWLYLAVAVLCVVGLLVSGCQPAEEEEEGPPAEEEEWVPPIAGMKPGEEDLYIRGRS